MRVVIVICFVVMFFLFKQKTAYEMRISDWSSDVCSSDLVGVPPEGIGLVLGVDRFLDMCRTTLNVTGDLVAATVVSAGEKDWDLAEHDPDISAEEKMARLPETQDQ